MWKEEATPAPVEAHPTGDKVLKRCCLGSMSVGQAQIKLTKGSKNVDKAHLRGEGALTKEGEVHSRGDKGKEVKTKTITNLT